VPLIACVPGLEGGRTSDDLVALADVTPTMMQLAGCPLPEYVDFQPLPGLEMTEPPARDYLFGMMGGGWMAFDGQWKLCKYSSGEHMLFDLENDPQEVHNRIRDDSQRHHYQRLDAALTNEIMRSVTLAHQDQLVYSKDLSNDQAFGQPGWQRPYPYSL